MTINLWVHASDLIDAAGVRALLDEAAVRVVLCERSSMVDTVVVVQDQWRTEDLLFVRAQTRGRDLPVVLVTGDLTESQLLEARECGVVAVLSRAKLDVAAFARAVEDVPDSSY